MNYSIIAAFASSTVAFTIGVMTYLYNRATLKEKKRSERRDLITKKLNEFYGPLLSYLNIVKALYQLFRANKPAGFRTLIFLLDRNQEYEIDGIKQTVVLSKSDEQLLKEIIEIEQKIEDLIVERGGLVDDPALMFKYIPDPTYTDVNLVNYGLLATAVAHFRILRRAYQGHIQGEVERFKDFVYPRELDKVLRERIEKLIVEQNQLNQ